MYKRKLEYNAVLVHFYGKFLLSGSKFPIRALSEVPAADPITPRREDEESTPNNWKIKMLYDGDCPLCMREVYFPTPTLPFFFSLICKFMPLYMCVTLVCMLMSFYGCEMFYRLTCLGRGMNAMVLSSLLT